MKLLILFLLLSTAAWGQDTYNAIRYNIDSQKYQFMHIPDSTSSASFLHEIKYGDSKESFTIPNDTTPPSNRNVLFYATLLVLSNLLTGIAVYGWVIYKDFKQEMQKSENSY